MFCSKCGQKLADDAVFCSKCGAPTETARAGQAPQKSERKVGKAVLCFIGATAIIVITILLAIAQYNRY